MVINIIFSYLFAYNINRKTSEMQKLMSAYCHCNDTRWVDSWAWAFHSHRMCQHSICKEGIVFMIQDCKIEMLIKTKNNIYQLMVFLQLTFLFKLIKLETLLKLQLLPVLVLVPWTGLEPYSQMSFVPSFGFISLVSLCFPNMTQWY